MTETHYAPDFRKDVRTSQLAVCGVRFWSENFSATPNCPQCAEWVARDQEAFDRTANAPYDDAPQPVRSAERDPVAEFQQEYRQRFSGGKR